MTVRDALLRGKRRPRALGAGSPTIHRGDGYEFVELRQYVPGDDVRRIDWAATARAATLQSRVVLEDVALTLATVVDTSPSMRVGKRRRLLDAAAEAVGAWYGAALPDDRCIDVAPRTITPPSLQRSRYAVVAQSCVPSEAFDSARALQTALGALPRGTALLAIGDWFDLRPDGDALLQRLGSRFDCTALIARDPWYDELPLRGIVRMRGAEGGFVRAFVGRRERAAYARAVREREATLLERFRRANWRTGLLYERDGARSLNEAFGVAVREVTA
ncbi:MAG TPA: DUF58 domain-containing protein [Candidatus Tumulicola sp.]|jgi:uncharacterized protein (DUF58 family)